jgi:hypothetical protein
VQSNPRWVKVLYRRTVEEYSLPRIHLLFFAIDTENSENEYIIAVPQY